MDNNLPRYELIFDAETMEGVYGVSTVFRPAMKSEEGIQSIMFSEQNEINYTIIENLLLKGETVNSDEWELIDEKQVNDESVYGIDLASVVDSNENEDSSQDNEILRIRYEYSPSSTSDNSRDFCKKMVNAGLSYRKEDLVFSGANPGFGANGADSYNIFLYKGGVNCKHFWLRKIYLRKDNKKLSVFEALKKIGELDKKSFSKAKIEVNPQEVGQVASADNNYWKLSSQLTDIKMSSEEKRILTGIVLIPEQNIYREFKEIDSDGKEKTEKCNVFLTADTIEKLQQNFFKNSYQKNSTLEHKEVIDGVFFFESWIVRNPNNDTANELGFNVPVGTWMMSMKVENDDIWNNYIKSGKVTGFSIDSRLGVQKNTKNKKEKMNYSKVKEMVMKSILMDAQLNEFKIDDSLSVYAESLEKDMVVFDKDKNPLANQEFTFEGKTFKTDDNGVIVEITEVEPAQDEQKQEVDAADEPAADATAETDSAKLQEELDAANKRIDELETENQALKAELVSVKEEVVNLSNQPASTGVNLNDVSNVDLESLSPYERYKATKSQYRFN
ncbi:XkdF-like putative serine protease domain-containing protein [Flavobacterium enshiense]|uniref:XkdF-like putative serine protease domain-containing protein n=1 Tax=Flavobacterium enshiense TaxID=1341165 RepID=UPI00345DAB26